MTRVVDRHTSTHPIRFADEAATQQAATVMQRGGLVAFPTETVYGLGADAANVPAVARVFEVNGLAPSLATQSATGKERDGLRQSKTGGGVSRVASPPVLLICCVDYRYIDAILQLARKRLGARTYDVKTDAGGTKALLNGDPAVRAWIMENLTLAYRRHGVRTAVLVHHEDCAAYGGSQAFKDQAEEKRFHAQQLAMAASRLRASFHDLTVRMFYAYRASRRMIFAEIAGSCPRDRGARRVWTRG